MKKAHGQAGFTLIELLIVITVLGILAAFAVPSYKSHMTKVRRADGKAQLSEILQAQERYYTQNNTYTTTLGAGGLGYTTEADLTVLSDEGYYKVSAAACGTGIGACVILTATPQGGQASDGNLTINSLNQKTGNWE